MDLGEVILMEKSHNKFFSRIATLLLLLILFASIVKISQGMGNHNQNIAEGKSYTLQPLPNYGLTKDADDFIQLTDGVYTKGYFWTQKSTVGWQGARPITITIDLGHVEPILGVSYNTAAGVAGVTWPTSIGILVSDDGKSYYAVGDLVTMSRKKGAPPAQGYGVFRYWTDELKTHGRYVQLVIDTGGPYGFVDEVEVYRGESEWVTNPLPGKSTQGATEYFENKTTKDMVQSRLIHDIQEARQMIIASDVNERDKAGLLMEISGIEKQISMLPPVKAVSFRAVLPINDLETRIFSIYGKVRQLEGRISLQPWVSNPYDYLTPTQKPDKDANNRVDVFMMRDEWRYAVINLTNSSAKAITAHLRINDLPGGVNPDFITAYQVEWTLTKEQKPIASALVAAQRDNDGYIITIPAGMVRQVWFSVHPENVPAGNYSGQIVVACPEDNSLIVPMSLQVFPLEFPQQPTLHLGGWDYTDGINRGVTEENRDLLVTQLRERFVDSPWASSGTLARGNFDVAGKMLVPSTQRFDQWIERWPNARRYCVCVSVPQSLDGAAMGTPEFYARVKSWIDFWVNHASSRGIKPEQLVLLLLDEPGKNEQDRIIIAWAHAIRAAQPQVVLWEDVAYNKPQQAMPEMLSSVDVLAPNRSQLLKGGQRFVDFYQQQRAAGRHLDLYSCQGPMELLDPYSYVRMQAWTAWVMGAEGTYFWSFSDTGGGSLWQPAATGTNYAPMFLASDSVTPAKHMEAMRESVEDYEYFVMLRNAVSAADPNNPAVPHAKLLLLTGAQRVLDEPGMTNMNWFEPKNRWGAEEVRLDILKTLVELQQK